MHWFRYIVVASLAWLSACGFQPLYQNPDRDGSVSARLTSITIPETRIRTVQLVRNELLEKIAPAGTSGQDLYHLSLTAKATEQAVIKGTNTDILRKSYRLMVTFKLVDRASGQTLLAGKSYSQISYDRTPAPFANRQARLNARERAAKQIGTDIHVRLAAYFSSHQ